MDEKLVVTLSVRPSGRWVVLAGGGCTKSSPVEGKTMPQSFNFSCSFSIKCVAARPPCSREMSSVAASTPEARAARLALNSAFSSAPSAPASASVKSLGVQRGSPGAPQAAASSGATCAPTDAHAGHGRRASQRSVAPQRHCHFHRAACLPPCCRSTPLQASCCCGCRCHHGHFGRHCHSGRRCDEDLPYFACGGESCSR